MIINFILCNILDLNRIFLFVNQFSKFWQLICVKFCKENILHTVRLNRKYLRNTVIRD